MNVFIKEESDSFQTIKIYENILKKEEFNQIKIAEFMLARNLNRAFHFYPSG